MDSSLLAGMVSRFGLEGTPVRLGGATGSVWAVDDRVLRIGPRPRITRELLVAAAASRAVTVPTILDRTDIGDHSGVLMKRVDGVPVGDLSGCSVGEARERGRRCGLIQLALADVRAPSAIPAAHGTDAADPGARLLHLDLHPLNVLMDSTGEVFTVIDWANASVGLPELDRARTATILTFDPAVRRFENDARWRALVAGWRETGGWDELSDRSWVWALQYMLDDLHHRHSEDELDPIRVALAGFR